MKSMLTIPSRQIDSSSGSADGRGVGLAVGSGLWLGLGEICSTVFSWAAAIIPLAMAVAALPAAVHKARTRASFLISILFIIIPPRAYFFKIIAGMREKYT